MPQTETYMLIWKGSSDDFRRTEEILANGDVDAKKQAGEYLLSHSSKYGKIKAILCTLDAIKVWDGIIKSTVTWKRVR